MYQNFVEEEKDVKRVQDGARVTDRMERRSLSGLQEGPWDSSGAQACSQEERQTKRDTDIDEERTWDLRLCFGESDTEIDAAEIETREINRNREEQEDLCRLPR